MNAYRIQNDIVAAHDEQEAIAVWAKFYGVPFNSCGPVEPVNPAEMVIAIEQEDGSWKDGPLAEVMPIEGPAEIVCFGEHEG